ncbi:MAG: hypothetical protein WAM82_20750 [Thermoanaerobaculia bacterium]
MDDPGSEVTEELRRLGWALPISRDQLLRVIEREGMPADFRDRGRWAADQLTELLACVRNLTAELPAPSDFSESLAEELSSFCLTIELTLQDVDLLIGDLQCILGDPNDLYPEDAN